MLPEKYVKISYLLARLFQ